MFITKYLKNTILSRLSTLENKWYIRNKRYFGMYEDITASDLLRRIESLETHFGLEWRGEPAKAPSHHATPKTTP